jgi:hypothetical protein
VDTNDHLTQHQSLDRAHFLVVQMVDQVNQFVKPLVDSMVIEKKCVKYKVPHLWPEAHLNQDLKLQLGSHNVGHSLQLQALLPQLKDQMNRLLLVCHSVMDPDQKF